jgi:hypothetical protein
MCGVQGLSPDQHDDSFMEPNTPEERIQRVSWPNASPTAHASTSSPASTRANSKSNSRKLEHNWDWHDLLGDMSAAATTPDTAGKVRGVAPKPPIYWHHSSRPSSTVKIALVGAVDRDRV